MVNTALAAGRFPYLKTRENLLQINKFIGMEQQSSVFYAFSILLYLQ